MRKTFQPDFLYYYFPASEIETLKQQGLIRPPIENDVEVPFPCFWLTSIEKLHFVDDIVFLFQNRDFQIGTNNQGKLMNIARIKIKYTTSLIQLDLYRKLLHGSAKLYLNRWRPRMLDAGSKRVYYYASIVPIYNDQWLSFQYFDGKKWKEVDGWMPEQNLLSLSDTIHS